MLNAHTGGIRSVAPRARSCRDRNADSLPDGVAFDIVRKPSANAVPQRLTPLKVIANVYVSGRKANPVGRVDAASSGTINQEEIATRPILRPREILEAIPGSPPSTIYNAQFTAKLNRGYRLSFDVLNIF